MHRNIIDKEKMKIVTVESECKISKFLDPSQGQGFYQFVKGALIEPDKEVLLVKVINKVHNNYYIKRLLIILVSHL